MSDEQVPDSDVPPPAQKQTAKAGGKGKKPGKQKAGGGGKFAEGTEWKLSAKGGARDFAATCLGTISVGGARIVMFKVPKQPA